MKTINGERIPTTLRGNAIELVNKMREQNIDIPKVQAYDIISKIYQQNKFLVYNNISLFKNINTRNKKRDNDFLRGLL